MSKRLLAAVLAVLLVAASVLACSDKAEEGQTRRLQAGETARVMFITQSLANPAQEFIWSEFERLQGEYNIEMSLISGNNDAAIEIAGIEQAISEGYDAIIITPSNADAIIPALTHAKDEGIVIGMFASELPEAHRHIRDFFTNSNDYESGKLAGQFVSELFPEGANYVEVGGQAGHDSQSRRRAGFRSGVASNINELASQSSTGGWSAYEAQVIMEEFLALYGTQIDVVWCHWDLGASGVIAAVQEAGRDDIVVVSVDGTALGYDLVKNGTLALTVGQSFTNMVIQSLSTTRQLLDGKSVPEVNYILMDIVTLDNVNTLPQPKW